MRKQFLIRVNVFLGVLSVMLAGCHVQKKATTPKAEEASEPPAQEKREPGVYTKYSRGRPTTYLIPSPNKKPKQDTTALDTTNMLPDLIVEETRVEERGGWAMYAPPPLPSTEE